MLSHELYHLKFHLTGGKKGPTPWRLGREIKIKGLPSPIYSTPGQGSHKVYEIISDPAARRSAHLTSGVLMSGLCSFQPEIREICPNTEITAHVNYRFANQTPLTVDI